VGSEPGSFPVADAVRMSMSIPYFFQPVELIHDETGLPSTIVDGGVLSNFPVWIFDVKDRDPLRPTFGFKLIGGKRVDGGLEKMVHAESGEKAARAFLDEWDPAQYVNGHGRKLAWTSMPPGRRI
jgi:predicted acylesterase/phospholipase RssA